MGLPRLLKKCIKCQVYTLNAEQCPSCGGPVKNAHPARFSIEDRYGSYRRKMKRELLSAHANDTNAVEE
jgi:H/ACA ribonucleoprotein complex subunit 3